MKRLRRGWVFWTTAILVSAAVCLAPSRVEADWTYEYREDFSTNSVEIDSFLHSVFWPQGAFPPPQTHLYYLDTGPQRELGFGDYNKDPALLGYCFPVGSVPAQRAISGYLQFDVRFPDSTDMVSGSLEYSLSDDGVIWSSARQLGPGSHYITLESVRGTCYVKFRGIEVLIDNIEVRLSSSPATIHVPRDFTTIQEAIDSAAHGDIVEVSAGTYTGDGNWDIDFWGKAITVRSEAGPSRTTIDCSGHEGHRGFYFHRGERQSSVLRGFTIIGAVVPGAGGGIYCEFSHPSIIDCVIRQCAAEVGGGIGSVGSVPTIIDCVIEDCQAGGLGAGESDGHGAGIALIRGSESMTINEAMIFTYNIPLPLAYYNSRGAGVYCWQSEALLANCDISFNSARGNIEGGGIYCGGSSTNVVLERCIISNNTAEAGGGIFASSPAYVRLTNCTIANNSLSNPNMSIGGGIHSAGSNIVIRNSIVWYNDGAAVLLNNPASNSSVFYSNIEGYYPGQNNINTNPLFASAAGTDYHLRSVLGRYYHGQWVTDQDNSPCIDAGDPQDPVGSEPFPNKKRINLGAYGGTHEASKSIGPLIFHVNGANGRDYNAGLSRAEAFATIQRAVDEAIDGDTIMVWPGVYREEVTFDRKAVTLQSADDAAVIEAPTGYAFSFFGAESSRAVLRNLVIANCLDAAIYCVSAEPTLINLTIANNTYGIYTGGGANPNITNCILWNNQFGDLFGDLIYQPRISYSCLQQQLAPIFMEEGNISKDPLFADPGNGDYHLQSEYGRYSPARGDWVTTDSLTSPCIDSGYPFMLRGREPHGGRLNMGAYGGTPYASKSGPSW
ncbi:hypothetical protein ES703_69806 [subsurface metagenome]